MNWSETNHYLKGICNKSKNVHDPIRIAAFDLDDTIINKINNRTKDKSSVHKWKLLDSQINKKIKKLIDDKYIIVIFSNQSGMQMNKSFNKIKWRHAINDLIKIMFKDISNFYVAIYVAKNYDLYRKPNLGMWNLMKENLETEFELDTSPKISKLSFFCGDAAGRISPSIFKKKLHPSSKTGDFSDSDRKFAYNIGINFITPEDFYLQNPPKMSYKLSGLDPIKFLKTVNEMDDEYTFKPRSKEMIIMVGPPGSGKTEFVNKFILPHEYIHISQDVCKSKKKCLSLTVTALEEGNSIVIDNTNPDVGSRMEYTMLAQKYKYKHIRCIIMDADINLAKHMSNLRHVFSKGKIPNINPIVYAVFKKKYCKPQKEENFDRIETVPFYFDKTKLKDPVWKKLFMKLSES